MTPEFRAAQLEALLTSLDLPDEEFAALARVIGVAQPSQEYLARQFAREWTEEDERKHPRQKDGKFGRKGGGEAAVKEKEEKPDREPPEFDPDLHSDEVEEERRRGEWVRSFNTYDENNDPWETDIHLDEGFWDPDPTDASAEPIDVYRWRATSEGAGTLAQGDWTADRDEAVAGAHEYADQNEEEPPEEEEEDEEEENQYSAEARELYEEWADEDKLLDLLGMVSDQPGTLPVLDGARVKIGGLEEGDFFDQYGGSVFGFHVAIKHPKLEDCERFIGIDSRGQRFIKNEILIIKKEHAGDGLGARIFSEQVRSASFEGFDYIKTHAAGSKGNRLFNGYYTWPRFGYDERIDSLNNFNRALAIKIHQTFNNLTNIDPPDSVLDILAMGDLREELGLDSEEPYTGRDWWRDNGSDLYNARFDLSEGSRSRRVLDAYLEERTLRKK